jgi:hypothetical protein
MQKLICNEYSGNKKIETFFDTSGSLVPTSLSWFQFNSTNPSIITKYNPNDILTAPKDIVIPLMNGASKITAIEIKAFYNSSNTMGKNIKSVKFELNNNTSNVTSIGDFAFFIVLI